MSHDVIVVGTGVAGLTAAVRLAEGGARVLVLAKGIGVHAPDRRDRRRAGLRPRAAARRARGRARRRPARRWPRCRTRIRTRAWAARRPWPRRWSGCASRSRRARSRRTPTRAGWRRTCCCPRRSACPSRPRWRRRRCSPATCAPAAPVCIVGFRQLKDFHPAPVRRQPRRRAPAPASRRAASSSTSPSRGRADVNAQGMARALEDPAVRGALVAAARRPAARRRARRAAGRARPRRPARGVVGPRAPARLARVRDPHAAAVRAGHAPLRAPARRAAAPPAGGIILGPEVVGGVGEGARLEGVRARDRAARGRPPGGRGRARHGRLRVRRAGARLALAAARGGARAAARRSCPSRARRASCRATSTTSRWRAPGIAVDDELRPLGEGGEPVYENVRVAGASLGGAVPWKEKSGDGISLASGHRAAELIARETHRGDHGRPT